VDVSDCCEILDEFEDWIWTLVNVDSRGSCSLTENDRGVVFFVVGPEVIVAEWTVLPEPLVFGRLMTLINNCPHDVRSHVLVNEPFKTLFDNSS
jgi:hypothetical protein